jgi:hypothetical protein
MLLNPGATCASECTASGAGLSGGIANVRAFFFVQAKDQFGNNKNIGGDVFRVFIQGLLPSALS